MPTGISSYGPPGGKAPAPGMDCRKGCLKIEAGLRRGIIRVTRHGKFHDGRPVAQHERAICQMFVDDRKCASLDLKKDRTAGCTG
jgi:hypothetical protein